MKTRLVILLLLFLLIIKSPIAALADVQDYAEGFTDAVTLVMQAIITNTSGDPNLVREEAQSMLTQAVSDDSLTAKEAYELTFYVSFAADVPVQLGLLEGSIQPDKLPDAEAMYDAIELYQSLINKYFQSGTLSITNKYALIIALDNIFDLYDSIITESPVSLAPTNTHTITPTTTPIHTSTPTPSPTEQRGTEPFTIRLEISNVTVTAVDPPALEIPNDKIESELNHLFSSTLTDHQLSLSDYADWLGLLQGRIGSEVTHAMLDTQTYETAHELQDALNSLEKLLDTLYRAEGKVTQEDLEQIQADIENIQTIRLKLFGVPATEAP